MQILDGNLKIDMRSHNLKTVFSVQSQNAAFGLPSSFSWLEKYKKQALGSPLPLKKDMSSNPFATDVFDPLKHMQLDKGTEDNRTGIGLI